MSKEEKNKGMSYVEGTVGVMHKIYKKGGIQGLREFVEELDVEKTLSIKRDSIEYRDALKDPEKLKQLFSKSESA